ncbi:patatin-like phospholipase family protein [Enterobacter roggenkampii]|uniref:patatin-like phospholipase family protein n=1 Tax=Enterobacter roggenkampii TaxID=1812935 RepID=UPI0020040341|nr:patatin-like phospholipase family protein [Enterobacter roggenkampii]MCK6873127.1 patatin-like phospholipase family protein [Enterobacter roggenkampii]
MKKIILCMCGVSFLAQSENTPPNINTSFTRSELGNITSETLLKDYAVENNGKGTPKIGLALSGGGTRAAYFALGILSGLSKSDVLSHIDVISSTSGGSYAAYWYFARQMESARRKSSTSNIFNDCAPSWWVKPVEGMVQEPQLEQTMLRAIKYEGFEDCGLNNTAHYISPDKYVWQAHLARWPDVFAVYPLVLTGNKQKKPSVKDIFFSLINGYSNNEKILATRYEDGLDRVWGLEPEPRVPASITDTNKNWRYANADATETLGSMYFRTNASLMNWEKWRKWRINNSKAPNWILNGRIGQKNSYNDIRQLYEITAYGHGSQSTGFRTDDFSDHTLIKAVTASAAFFDYQGLPFHMLNILGRNTLDMINRNQAAWGVDIIAANGSKVRVSDGGSLDNTGVISLVKRNIPEIIVVDAGYDVSGNMDDLCNIKSTLNNGIPEGQSKFDLQINNLENLDAVCNKANGLGYNTSEWLNPIMEGTISWPLNKKTGKPRFPPIKLWYIKLAWNQRQVSNAYTKETCGTSQSNYVSCIVAAYYGMNSQNTLSDNYLIFPQLKTDKITYNSSTYLFWAYRELGKNISQRLAYDPKNGQLIKVALQKNNQQKTLKIRAGLRPNNLY